MIYAGCKRLQEQLQFVNVVEFPRMEDIFVKFVRAIALFEDVTSKFSK